MVLSNKHSLLLPLDFHICRKLLALILISFLYFHVASAATREAGAFLKIGVGARAMGIGGAFTAVSDDGTAFYWNPAGISLVRDRELSAMYSTLFGISDPLASYHSVSILQPLATGEASVSLGWLRLSVDDIPLYPELPGGREGGPSRWRDPGLQGDGRTDSYFTDREDALFFSFSKMNRFNLDLGWQYFVLPLEFPVGFNLKYIRYMLDGSSAQGIGLDLGGMVRFGANDMFDVEYLGDVSFGFSVHDVANTAIIWDTKHQDEIPYNFRVGLAYIQPFPAIGGRLTVSWERDAGVGKRKRIGFEYVYRSVVALRGGYNGNGVSAGTGFAFRFFRFDYAILSHELGAIHRLSGAIRF